MVSSRSGRPAGTGTRPSVVAKVVTVAVAALTATACGAGSGGTGLRAGGTGPGAGGTTTGAGRAGVVYQGVPAKVPTELRNRVCMVPGRGDRGPVGHPLATVDPHPSAVTLVWLPGLNQRPCHSERASYGPQLAGRLADDVDRAPAFPPGAFSCPMDDGSSLDLYFAYPGTDRREYVRVDLTGCSAISAPGRAVRRSTEELHRDLAPLVPSDWWRP